MKKKKSRLLWEFISKRVVVMGLRFWGCWGDWEREECMLGEEEEALILGENCLAKCRTKPSKLFLISWPEILQRIFKATSSPNEASVNLVLVSSGLRFCSLQILAISSSTTQGSGTILSLFISAMGFFSTDLLKKGSGSAKCYLKLWARVAGFGKWVSLIFVFYGWEWYSCYLCGPSHMTRMCRKTRWSSSQRAS
jgi:hypothetical protein